MRCTWRIYQPPNSGVAPERRGTFAGLVERIAISKTSRDGGRAVADFAFDLSIAPRPAGELLGICPHLVLRAPSGLQLAPRAARSARRISRYGQSLHRQESRLFSTWSTTTRARATSGANSVLQGFCNPSITSSKRTRRDTQTTAAAETRSIRAPGRAPADPRELALLVQVMHVDGFVLTWPRS